MLLISSSAFGQSYISNTARTASFFPNEGQKQICQQVHKDLQRHFENINEKLWRYETHPSDGYDISHRIRIEITGIIYTRTNHIVREINHNAYVGDGEGCKILYKDGVNLSNYIFEQNIALRRTDANAEYKRK